MWENLTGGSSGGMPDRDVTTIRDLIYYQYAKITARSTFSVSAPHIIPRSAPSLLEKKYQKTIYNCHVAPAHYTEVIWTETTPSPFSTSTSSSVELATCPAPALDYVELCNVRNNVIYSHDLRVYPQW